MRTKFTNILITSLFLFSTTTILAQQKPANTAPSQTAKRLKYKLPLPPQPSLKDLVHAKGEITVELFINNRGEVDKVKLMDGPQFLFNKYYNFLQSLKFEPAYKNDSGPWVVNILLFLKSSETPVAFHANMQFVIQDVRSPATEKK